MSPVSFRLGSMFHMKHQASMGRYTVYRILTRNGKPLEVARFGSKLPCRQGQGSGLVSGKRHKGMRRFRTMTVVGSWGFPLAL